MDPFQQAVVLTTVAFWMELVVFGAVTFAALLLFQRHQELCEGTPADWTSVKHVMLLKLLLTTLQGMLPTVSPVMTLFPAAAELGKPLPVIVTRVPPARLPVLGLTVSTCAYTWNCLGGRPGAAVMKVHLFSARPPAKRPSNDTDTFTSPATPTPIWGSP